jgi:hypothetical protein
VLYDFARGEGEIIMVIGSAPAASGFQPPPNYICTSNSQYSFCAPQASGDYYIAIPQNSPSQNDQTRIRSWFNNYAATAVPVSQPPQEFSSIQGYRFYNVTSFLSAFILSRNGTRDDVVGPNCYQAVLTSAGYAGFYGRHVSPDEFEYYLKRDYLPVYCGKIKYGALIVYDAYPTTYDAGDHAAFHLLGGLVFQKGGWEHYYPYENTTIEEAMNSIGSYWRPAPEDRFGNPTWPGASVKWQHLCYEKRPEPLERTTSSTARDRNWFLPLIEYYTKRLENVSNFSWNDFKQNRIDLLTIENMWHLQAEFNERVGNFNPLEVLLSIDDNIAEAHFKLHSLSWQYQAMVDTYYPIKTRWHYEALYREHYVNFNDDFYEELKLYLELLNAPKSKWDEIIADVVAKIKTYDPVQLANTSGAVPYFSILEKAIAAHPDNSASDSQKTSSIPEGTSTYKFPQDGIMRYLLGQDWYNKRKEAQESGGFGECRITPRYLH